MGRPRKKALTNNQCENNPATEIEAKKASELQENDQNKLLRIFPEEVWDMIFDKYTDCESLCNFYNASPYLKKQLADRRTRFLFPKVWNKVLGKMYIDNYRRRRMRYPVTAFREDIGSKEHNQWVKKLRAQGKTVLWYSGILKMRLVCKTWSVAIERFYQNLEIHHIMHMHGSTRDPYNYTDGISKYNFACSPDKSPGKFLDYFKHTHGSGGKNPFITSNVHIFIRSGNETLEFRTDMQTILRKYGLHIRHLTVSGIDFNPLPVFYLTLQNWLRLMPNLETLRLTQETHRSLNSEETLDLNRYIQSNPLPTCKSLKFLSIDLLSASLSKLLFQKNPGIGKVELLSSRGILWSDQAWIQVCELKAMAYLNLTQLGISIRTEGELENVVNIGKPWRLQKLNLQFLRYIQWSRVFKLLENKWEESLTDLFLALPQTLYEYEQLLHQSEFANLNLKLNLPMVKRLKLNMRDFACLDFISPMKDSLEELEISYFPVSKNFYRSKLYKHLVNFVLTQQEIQLVGFYDKLLDSNIWTLFPKLGQTKLVWDNRYFLCSRNQWESK